ncbi:MAG: dockerin type I domain-containing protein [Phycisphaerae bacterium]|nr:dockerin type I domain-containing protein [Phycisphaerae bacterium]
MRSFTRNGVFSALIRNVMLSMGFVLALAALGQAEPVYIYGLHDPGGESNMGSSKGWIVFTEAIGRDPNNLTGKNYTSYSNQGYGVIVRINHGYYNTGTLPAEAYYDDFATRCANYVKASPGVDYWIIGNETNLNVEWPGYTGTSGTGEPITVARYVSCYNKCYTQIKAVAPTAKLCPSPTGVWAPPLPTYNIPGFIQYWTDTLNGIGASKIDGLPIHAYTHGADVAFVTSETKMGGSVYPNIYYHFRVYKNYMAAIPASMKTKPVFITECDQNTESADNSTPYRNAWLDVNNGWVRAIYDEINTWNDNNAQKIRCVALYRWPSTPDGAYNFGIQNRPLVIQDFQQACAKGYKWVRAPQAPTGLNADAGVHQVTLSWAAMDDATSYNIRRQPVNDSSAPFVTVGTSTTNSFVDTSITAFIGYFYVVSAVNPYGESVNSSSTYGWATVGPDINFDSFVDDTDLAYLMQCALGPGIPVAPNCLNADFNGDGAVDQEDFAIFQRCRFSYDSWYSDPTCDQ